MVLPFILGAFFAVDMVIMLATGKDIIQHATGVDIYAPIVDPIVDFITGDSSGGGSAYLDEWGNAIIDNQDAWGNAIMDGQDAWGMAVTDLLYVTILAVVVLALIVMWRTRKARFKD